MNTTPPTVVLKRKRPLMVSFQATNEAMKLLSEANPEKITGVQTYLINRSLAEFLPKVLSGKANVKLIGAR